MGEWKRVIIHLDMDAFFASVEQLDNPELRGRPVAVGGAHRGVVSAASYEARAYGVRSALPVATAKRLCPQLIMVRGRYERYSELSAQVMAILHSVSPLVEQVSVDEAYVDLSGTQRIMGPPLEVVQALRARVLAETGLTCSVGIAPNKYIAKIASDMNKPDGVFVVRPSEVAAFLAKLPVGRIPGVGKKTKEQLHRYGVKLVGDVLKRPQEFWTTHFGERGQALVRRALGEDDSPVVPRGEAKSCSAETTLDQDVSDKTELSRWLMVHAERVGRDLRKHHRKGRTVTLRYKYADFTQHTRSRTLDVPTDSTEVIFETARDLLGGTRLQQALRLIGLGVSNFNEPERQLPLFAAGDDQRDEGCARLDGALDAIRDRFGIKAVSRGRTFGLKNRR